MTPDTALRQKLGSLKSSKKKTWNVTHGTGGTLVKLAYESEFDAGRATETFVYRIKDGKAVLVAYHIDSNALLEKP